MLQISFLSILLSIAAARDSTLKQEYSEQI